MRFCDLCGPPGSGKSTLADPIWDPHAVPISGTEVPAEWDDFVAEISHLFGLIREHPSFDAALRMNRRSLRKMATVYREPPQYGAMMNVGDRKLPLAYVQTGLAQRGLGFGWRLNQLGRDLNELRPFFRLMPVSLGVAVIRCPQNIVEQRNHARKRVPKTSHEDRAFMVPLMQPAIEIAIEELSWRKIPLLEIDTTQPINDARNELLDFVENITYCKDVIGYSGHSVFPAPIWF